MGKSNRIRANRANAQVKSLGTKQNKKGMPSWLMTLITVTVAVIVLAAVAVSLMASNGVFGRMKTIVSSDNYKVNENMLAYYYSVQYNDFVTNNESLLSSSSFDKEKDPRDQKISADNYIDTYLTGGATGTWHDFFMKQTLDSVTTVLAYCEEADDMNLSLTKEEKKEINDSIDELGTMASLYGYSLNAYISMSYGEGVQATDLRKAMEYSTLASKCATQIAENLEAAITDGRIDETYAKDPSKFDKINYLTVTMAETYANLLKEEFGDTTFDKLTADQKTELATLYAERVAKYKALAEKLNAATDIDSFKSIAADYFADYTYDSLYDSTLETLNKTATDEAKKTNSLPEGQTSVDISADVKKEDLAKIKDMIVANVLEAIKTKAEKPTLTITIPDKAETVKIESLDLTVNAKFASMCNTLITSLFTEVQSDLDGMLVEKANKIEDNEFLEWAFEADRAELNVKQIVKEVKEGDDIEGKDTKVTVDAQTYSVSVYMLTKLPTKDTDPTRNGAYMVLENETKAKDAIAELKKDSVTLEKFKAYADKNQIGYAELDDYIKGSLGYAAFDTWFYGDIKENALTDTPIQMDSYYAVAIYTGAGTEQWYIEVKNEIFSADSEAKETAIKEKHVVTVNNERVAKLDF